MVSNEKGGKKEKERNRKEGEYKVLKGEKSKNNYKRKRKNGGKREMGEKYDE